MNASSRLIRSAAVVRLRIWFVTLVALSALFGTLLPAQVSDEAKRQRTASLKAQEETESESSGAESPTPFPKAKAVKAKAKPIPEKSPSPKPKKSPSPKPKARKKHKPPEDEETPKPKAKSSARADEEPAASSKSRKKHKPSEDEETPKPKAKSSARADEESAASSKSEEVTPKPSPQKKKSSAKKEPSPGKKKKATAKAKALPGKEEEEKPPKAAKVTSPLPSETPGPRPSAPPRAVAIPAPSAVPAPGSTITADNLAEESAQLTIEKTGYEKRRGFWSRVFGSGGRSSSGSGYRYLTRSVRAEIDRAPADRRNPRWQFIIVHNSGTRQGNARAFDYYHRHVRHMQNGLAYHFVIGNGTSTGNGQIEVGDRWRRQINGGHVHSDHLNNIALGICLVGDFNRDQPTRAQLECCEELIRYLRQRCGKVDNHFPIVKPHREVNPPRWATDCPGDVFPYSWFRRF